MRCCGVSLRALWAERVEPRCGSNDLATWPDRTRRDQSKIGTCSHWAEPVARVHTSGTSAHAADGGLPRDTVRLLRPLVARRLSKRVILRDRFGRCDRSRPDASLRAACPRADQSPGCRSCRRRKQRDQYPLLRRPSMGEGSRPLTPRPSAGPGCPDRTATARPAGKARANRSAAGQVAADHGGRRLVRGRPRRAARGSRPSVACRK